MPKVPPEGREHDPDPRGGWLSQVIALIRAAVLHPTWDPTAKLVVLAIVGVTLYIAMQVMVHATMI